MTHSSPAVLGSKPRFEKQLNVGQLEFPSWEEFREVFDGIFERRWYTNHGPLTEELEAKLADYLGVKHAMTMTNGTIGLMVAAKALGLEGKVVLPAFTFIASAQSLTWCGLDPVFCDVDPFTHNMSAELVEPLLSEDVSAIMGVHLWGNPCDIDGLSSLAENRGIQLYFDAAQAFASEYKGTRIAGFGNLEVFSFHATKLFSATEGGLVCTDDDDLAKRVRNIRSSYGAGPAVPVPFTANGRFSEAQAGMALLSLKALPGVLNRCSSLKREYQAGLVGIPGIRVHDIDGESVVNNQYVVIEVSQDEFGLDRDMLAHVLKADNVYSRRYFRPGVHRTGYYASRYPEYLERLPVTDQLCDKVLQLPSGQGIDSETVSQVCDIVKLAHDNAEQIREVMSA